LFLKLKKKKKVRPRQFNSSNYLAIKIHLVLIMSNVTQLNRL